MDLDADAQAVRQAVELAVEALDLPLDAITVNTLAVLAGVFLAGVAASFALVVRGRRLRSRRVAPTMYLPRHPVRAEARPWWKRERPAEPIVDIRTSLFAEELAALGIADPAVEHRAGGGDGPHPLPGQHPWSWQ